MNALGVAAVALSVVVFAIVQRWLRPCPVAVRLGWLGGFALLSVPALWFAMYYLHVLPEYAWFYTLRSWPGSEFLVVFLGGAAGAVAACLPRLLLGLPLFALLALAAVPYLKPLIGPLPDEVFREQVEGDICLQSTGSTCGPASITTILRQFGLPASERTTARAAFTYAGGTEAWYLARYVRARGLTPRFAFRRTFSPEAGQPALVGVILGGVGHFIPVLAVRDGQVTFADPLHGEEHLPLSDFQRRYQFTGFHLVVQRP